MGGCDWAVALEIGAEEEAEPLEGEFRSGTVMIGKGAPRFPAWRAVYLREVFNLNSGYRRISIFRDRLG